VIAYGLFGSGIIDSSLGTTGLSPYTAADEANTGPGGLRSRQRRQPAVPVAVLGEDRPDGGLIELRQRFGVGAHALWTSRAIGHEGHLLLSESAPLRQRLLRQNLGLALEATRLDPASLPAAQALGSVYLLLGRPDDAAAEYNRALALQPAAEIYMNLGHAYRASGAADQARANYQTAVALDERLRAQVPAGAL